MDLTSAATLGSRSATTERPARRTALYRMFDGEGVLLYVGIAYSFGRRWAQEAVSAPWYPEVQRQTVDWYPSREEAHRLEIEAIQTEKPKYNIAHAVKPPRSRKRRGHIEARETVEPDYDRIVAMDGATEDDAGSRPYPIDSPRIVAPGTYLITFDYDPADHKCEPIRISQMVLVDAGDEVARRYGGTCEMAAESDADPMLPSLPPRPCRCYRCRQVPKPRPAPRCTCDEQGVNPDGSIPMPCAAHPPEWAR